QVRGRPARIAGGVWLSYLPLVFAARYLHAHLELEETVHPAVIYGVLLGLCLPAGAIIVLKSAFGGSGHRRRGISATGARNPFAQLPGPAPVSSGTDVFGPDDFFAPPAPSKPAPGKKPARRPSEKNPFDFS